MYTVSWNSSLVGRGDIESRTMDRSKNSSLRSVRRILWSLLAPFFKLFYTFKTCGLYRHLERYPINNYKKYLNETSTAVRTPWWFKYTGITWSLWKNHNFMHARLLHALQKCTCWKHTRTGIQLSFLNEWIWEYTK